MRSPACHRLLKLGSITMLPDIDAARPDVVVMADLMPGMNGTEDANR